MAVVPYLESGNLPRRFRKSTQAQRDQIQAELPILFPKANRSFDEEGRADESCEDSRNKQLSLRRRSKIFGRTIHECGRGTPIKLLLLSEYPTS